jgi:hypothetical protein
MSTNRDMERDRERERIQKAAKVGKGGESAKRMDGDRKI